MSRRLTAASTMAVLIALMGLAHPNAAGQDVDTCTADARGRAATAIAEGAVPYDARRQLEIDVVRCVNPEMPEDTAAFVGTINADLADFAHQFLIGSIDALTYRNARVDRSRKLQDLGGDDLMHAGLVNGDEDGDLIPDDRDGCPSTARGTPTDDDGCPVPGSRRAPAGGEHILRRLLGGLTLLKNEACNDAPEPLASKPYKWGRSSTNSPIPLGSFKFAVAQVSGMPDGCEVFYEFRLLFLDPVNASAPPTREVSIVFGEREDLDPDPKQAIFGLPPGPQPSAGRSAAYDAFQIYQRMKWRVRTAIGGPVTSPWSAPIIQSPVSGGIP